MFEDLENQTVAIHVAQRTWEGTAWRDALHLRGLSDTQIECLVEEAEACDRGMIAGKYIDHGHTHLFYAMMSECILVMIGEAFIYAQVLDFICKFSFKFVSSNVSKLCH